MKLNPEGVSARKEHAKQTRQRVELRREDTGNASLAGRELDPADRPGLQGLHRRDVAVRIRNHGRAEGPLSAIGAHVMTELLQGRNPLDLLKPRPRRKPDADPDAHRAIRRRPRSTQPEPRTATPPTSRDPDDPGPDYPGDLDGYDGPGDPTLPGYAGPDGAPAWTAEDAANAQHAEPDDPAQRRGPLRPSQSAPPPANLNLIIPIGNLLGWSATPAQAGRSDC